MMDERLEKAKKILKKHLYFLDCAEEDEEWIKLNVLESEIVLLYKDYISEEFEKIHMIINSTDEKEKKNELWSKCCLSLKGIFYLVDEFKLTEYFDNIVEMFELMNYDECLLYSQIEYSSEMYNRHCYLCDRIIKDKETKRYSSEYDNIFEDNKHYLFNNKERFFGLLPSFYNIKRMDLFYRLLDVSYDLIINFGSKSYILIRDLYNYSKIINDEKFTNDLKSAIRKWVINSIKYEFLDFVNAIQSDSFPQDLDDIILLNNQIMDFIEIDKIHFDKDVEISWIKRLFCYLHLKYGSKIYSLRIINDTLEYYNIDKSILTEWIKDMPTFFLELLDNADKFFNTNTEYVDLNKHSKYYIDYLKKVKEPSLYLWRIINYCLALFKNNPEKMNIINKCLKTLYDKNRFNKVELYGVYKELIISIMPENEDGLLEKYYKENKDLFEIYKTISILISRCNYPIKGYYDYRKRVLNFAKGINDKELIEAYSKW